MIRTFGWLLGIEQATSIDQLDVSLAAPWVQDRAFWIFLLAVAVIVGALLFYLRLQSRGTYLQRLSLGLFRGALLALLLLTLADPVLELTLASRRRPLMYVIFDGTDSMAIEDELPESERAAIEKAVDWKKPEGKKKSPPDAKPTRIDYVRALLASENNPLDRLAQEKNVEIEAYLFDGNTTSQLRKLTASSAGRGRFAAKQLAEQLSTKGQVTALGEVVSEIGQQLGSSRAIGALVFSDFAHNSGLAPLGSGGQSPAARLGMPVYAVGVGASEAIDLAVDLQTDPRMKRAERSNLAVKVRQSGLSGQSATIRVTGKRLSGEAAAGPAAEFTVGQKTITLKEAVETIDLPFTPEEAGRYEFVAKAEKLAGEVVEQNNQAARQVNIIDDYLRLMYVAYEPTWEWRFIKEVFHRDKLVGMEGFRTFLSSSDPRVRESNVIFQPTLTPKRS
jgi:hypothetical protein